MFKFKLQSVLDYRLNIEEKILNEFSELKREEDRQEAILAALLSEKENMIAGLRNTNSSTLKAEDISSILDYVNHLRERENEQQELIRQAKEATDEKRKALIEAVKNRKVMENLKEKHETEYIQNINATEQKISDEMFILKFGRRGK